MRILLIGRGFIGAAVEKELSSRHEVIALTRNSEPSLDFTDEGAVRNFFESQPKFDAVISCVGHVPFGGFNVLEASDYLKGFEGKILPQVNLTRIATDFLADSGSITLTTGILARYPIVGGTVASMANGAVESFVLAAAPVLPRGLRLNAVSPSLLEENKAVYSAFPGVVPVSSHRVAMAYAQSVEGIQTGQIYKVD